MPVLICVVHSCSNYLLFQFLVTSATNDDDSNNIDGKSVITIIGAVIGVLVVVAISCILCLAYLKYYQFRQRNFIAQQRRPRILIPGVTSTTTLASGPPPPPPYSPTQPNSDYTPVPPRGYQQVSTNDYATAPATPSSDVPSEPPPEYTPSVSINVSPPVN